MTGPDDPGLFPAEPKSRGNPTWLVGKSHVLALPKASNRRQGKPLAPASRSTGHIITQPVTYPAIICLIFPLFYAILEEARKREPTYPFN